LAAVKSLLLDTGPLIAYLNSRDQHHDEAAERIDSFSGEFHTTGAVITEAMHMVSPARDGPALLAEFVTASGSARLRTTRAASSAATLMAKYADTPMDYADATLVLLAERIGVLDVLTLDRRGFSAYRTSKGLALRMIERA
jgi:predicted nucleic acid-binding protein